MSLELGGNNAFVVLDDADLEARGVGRAPSPRSSSRARCASRRGATSSTAASPRTTSTSWPRRPERIRLGDPYREDVDLGPIVNQKQLERVDGIVRRSVDAGATVVVGGTHEGLFYRPTVLTDVTTDHAAWREEIFGPVAPVVVFDTDEEALALANDTEYGLTGAVYSRSISRGLALAQRFTVGDGPRERPDRERRGHDPVRRDGRVGHRPLRRAGELGRVHRVAVGHRARRRALVPLPVLSGPERHVVHHRGRPARRRVRRHGVARRVGERTTR